MTFAFASSALLVPAPAPVSTAAGLPRGLLPRGLLPRGLPPVESAAGGGDLGRGGPRWFQALSKDLSPLVTPRSQRSASSSRCKRMCSSVATFLALAPWSAAHWQSHQTIPESNRATGMEINLPLVFANASRDFIASSFTSSFMILQQHHHTHRDIRRSAPLPVAKSGHPKALFPSVRCCVCMRVPVG